MSEKPVGLAVIPNGNEHTDSVLVYRGAGLSPWLLPVDEYERTELQPQLADLPSVYDLPNPLAD